MIDKNDYKTVIQAENISEIPKVNLRLNRSQDRNVYSFGIRDDV